MTSVFMWLTFPCTLILLYFKLILRVQRHLEEKANGNLTAQHKQNTFKILFSPNSTIVIV